MECIHTITETKTLEGRLRYLMRDGFMILQTQVLRSCGTCTHTIEEWLDVPIIEEKKDGR